MCLWEEEEEEAEGELKPGLAYKINKKSSLAFFIFFSGALPFPALNARTHRPGPAEDSPKSCRGIEAGTRRGTESSLPSLAALLPLAGGGLLFPLSLCLYLSLSGRLPGETSGLG